MKNCGTLIHDEIATKQYMEQLKELVKTSQHENVRLKTLELIQAWAHAFRHSPKYRAVQVKRLQFDISFLLNGKDSFRINISLFAPYLLIFHL